MHNCHQLSFPGCKTTSLHLVMKTHPKAVWRALSLCW